MADLFEAVEFLRRSGETELQRLVRGGRGVLNASLRFEVVARRAAAAENGTPRAAGDNENASLGLSVLVGGTRGATGFGYCGLDVGRLAMRRGPLLAAVRQAFLQAFERARLNARQCAAILPGVDGQAGIEWQPASPHREALPGHFKRDPREVDPQEIQRLCQEVSTALAGMSDRIVFNTIGVFTELRHELLITSEGTSVSQEFAFSQGNCYVVAQGPDGHEEIFDTIGQQRGLECLVAPYDDPLMPNPDLMSFAQELATEARMLADSPPLRAPDHEVVVVTDPHFNALLSHEIVGHPSEADRALKMEAGYAGRSWFLRSLADSERGQPVAAPMLSAASDPGLPGYGHYRYDHEGTPGRRVLHIDRGRFRDFLNSRATAALLGEQPNGSMRASEARYAPLIRMSNTFFLGGQTPPEQILSEVDQGYYVCGNKIPSVGESREAFRISARRVYAIEHGRLGQLYRGGSVMGNSREFFSHVDAVGNDLRIFPIPNCGKGQPMQVKRMSNGGPTLRSRARLAGS